MSRKYLRSGICSTPATNSGTYERLPSVSIFRIFRTSGASSDRHFPSYERRRAIVVREVVSVGTNGEPLGLIHSSTNLQWCDLTSTPNTSGAVKAKRISSQHLLLERTTIFPPSNRPRVISSTRPLRYTFTMRILYEHLRNLRAVLRSGWTLAAVSRLSVLVLESSGIGDGRTWCWLLCLGGVQVPNGVGGALPTIIFKLLRELKYK